jgi:D-glycero-D-manno-heptose 1,7-bisphosphate phosphatase
MSKAIFLDRDGTLIVDKDYLSDPMRVELLPGVGEALHHALKRDYHLFMLTNQSGVGRGYFSMDDVHACNRRMLALLDLPEPGFKEICIAPETPDEPSKYRKPSPRFILEMVEKYQLITGQCTMVGDHLTDIESGINAGINVAAVNTGKKETAEQLLSIPEKVPIYESLKEFIVTLT